MNPRLYKRGAVAPILLAALTASQSELNTDIVCLFLASMLAAFLCIVMAAKSEAAGSSHRRGDNYNNSPA